MTLRHFSHLSLKYKYKSYRIVFDLKHKGYNLTNNKIQIMTKKPHTLLNSWESGPYGIILIHIRIPSQVV